MLRRISQIINVGRFQNSSCGGVQFEKITLIYGRNTYGKSTLGDLLSSIESGNFEIVNARKTIPADGKPQNAIIKFTEPGNTTEMALTFNELSWTPPLPANLHLRVFDEGFYHNNIFSARHFTRDTKVKFSAFILGSSGVQKAQEIAEKNKEKRTATIEKNKLEKAAFSTIPDLLDFVHLHPTESQDTLQLKIDTLRREYDALQKQQKEAEEIKARNELSEIHWRDDFLSSLNSFSEALSSSLASHHKAAQEKVIEHINNHFQDSTNAFSWIRQGLRQNNGERCQLCGQILGAKAKELFDLYRLNFDESYESHEKEIKQQIEQNQAFLAIDRISSLRIALANNNATLSSYPELDGDSGYKGIKEKILSLKSILDGHFIDWSKQQEELGIKIKEASSKKIAAPNIALDTIDASKIIELDTAIKATIKEYHKLVHHLNTRYEGFKRSVEDDQLVEKMTSVQKKRLEESRKLKRIELASQCDEFEKLRSNISRLESEIPSLQEALREEQSEFLDKFFVRLNEYFVKFGSQEFQLEKGEDTSGYTPVYFLQVKFKGHKISERDLDRVFSESDRRALALAVFWAFLSGIDDAEKPHTIVILDDPVTSFDNNRITAVHQQIIEISNNFRQVISLSHYKEDIVKFLQTYKNSRPIKLLSITCCSGFSNIIEENQEDFIRNEHEQMRENMLRFIDGESNSHNSSDLRIFLEIEINNRFAKQIHSYQINEQNLSDRIDKLVEHSIITYSIGQQLHSWREILNPSHHIWASNDLEDKRNTARDFMQFVYKDLVPA